MVASCDTDGITLSYNSTYVSSSNSYNVSGVVTSGVSTNCIGKPFKLTLSSGGAALGNYAGTITATSQTITVSPTVVAGSIAGAALIISG